MPRRLVGKIDRFCCLAVVLTGVFFAIMLQSPLNVLAENTPVPQNKLVSIETDFGAERTMVKIVSEKPVGYRYTVYDSFDPIRVVVDFPGMDVSALPAIQEIVKSGLTEIRVSSFDLTSGTLGRIELLLTTSLDYTVSLNGTEFSLSFAQTSPIVTSTSTKEREPSEIQGVAVSSEDGAGQQAVAVVPFVQKAEPVVGIENIPSPLPAKNLQLIEVQDGSVILHADGFIEKYQYFTLGAPPRLVLDLQAVKPVFKDRFFSGSNGIDKIRVGIYPDKTRVVFDGGSRGLPDYAVVREASSIKVSIGNNLSLKSDQPKKIAGVPVSIEGIDFLVENGHSILKIALSGTADLVEPVLEGDIIRFGIKNASINRSLRRTIDATAFPSAVRQVTPFPVDDKKSQTVSFAIQLKGPVPYSFSQEGGTVKLVVTDGPFAEPEPPVTESIAIPVPSLPPASTEAPVPVSPKKAQPVVMPSKQSVVAVQPTAATSAIADMGPVEASGEAKVTGTVQGPTPYKGQKISLVFDNADIRNILQLIGEVSELNIIAGEEVKGTITLRLVDVPWDQALDLIMETKGLGMVLEGNVARILPKEMIRSMRQEELAAVKEERNIEPTVTEVISVSYTALTNISAAAKELLSDRGKMTEDNRNKQLIVTDVPSIITQIKNLVVVLDTPERQVMIEARIVEANSSFGRDLGVKWGLSYDNPNGGPGDVSGLNVGLGGSFLISPPASGTVSSSAGLGSGITFGRLGIDSTVLDLRISALESSGHGKIISSPRVTTLNGGEASISQGTKIPYTSVSSEGTKVEFIDAVLGLTVTPVINPDRSVILDIKASNSSIGTFVSGSVPSIDAKEAKTKVLVRDGETTVIGGIFKESENTGESGVPILQSIPLLGHLFKSTNVTKSRAEIMIFITPRILD